MKATEFTYEKYKMKRNEKKGYTKSGYTRLSVPLKNAIYILLQNEADLIGTFPQTLAKQIITKYIKEQYK